MGVYYSWFVKHATKLLTKFYSHYTFTNNSEISTQIHTSEIQALKKKNPNNYNMYE